jgi:hypothetical protein
MHCFCSCAAIPPQIRWRSSASAALPLGQEACARRLAFFKRKPQIKAFIDNLQAQVRRVICCGMCAGTCVVCALVVNWGCGLTTHRVLMEPSRSLPGCSL